MRALPAAWAALTGNWLCIQLREQFDEKKIEQQLAAHRAAERERTARVASQGQWIKRLALLAAVVLAIFVIVAVAYLLKHNSRLLGR